MNCFLLASSVNWTTVWIALAIMFGVSIVFALLITVISKVFAVKTDTRVEEITSLLPNANCGGCGYPGCAGLAQAIVDGKAPIDACAQCVKANRIKIANIMGVSFEGGEETIAVVHCTGGIKCEDKYEYNGYGDCKSQSIMSGGRKMCEVGCMGVGSCVDACPYYAVEVKEGVAVVDQSLCVSCGNCILACPKKIIERIPKSAKIYIGCSSRCKGKDVTLMCKSGCIGCGICQRTCKHDAIHLQNNVPVIDYSKCIGCKECMAKCPRHVIRELK
ncbi:MAG: RnfABCDGE type electron transport complex subunit B [Clostridia bacterium]|nr:RnfABCDGE type electron transport complex subunit B [Clostridia bacterium]